MRIGIIGSGAVGSALLRRARAAKLAAAVANSRGPSSLARLGAQAGAAAGTVEEVAEVADMVVLAVPFGAVRDLPARAFDGRVVIDATNHLPERDGPAPEVEGGTTASSLLVAAHLSGARVVKAFNTLPAEQLERGARPAEDPERLGVPVAADDEDAKALVSRLVDRLGFTPVDGGTLADSEDQEPGTPVFGAVATADEVRTLLHGGRGAQSPHAPRAVR
ncbi:NADPH-dependent F420 reductase [Quadrisphaera sp. DSM 44207]|uniref:NADPH-dependent F420 reductase n=1 Tax=Quadrisphaera sp. DSM 44207 TaxID=1881057 RepID=UPI000883630A|nr:NAD(P)-binding domain-containing protein [Quadrisphaera sp. DSM 44207]SDQ37716.1 hypothetical protein SAMN05428996_1463 [Quadrisphaera sp. DSM 44207]